jgi:hypothetical protein
MKLFLDSFAILYLYEYKLENESCKQNSELIRVRFLDLAVVQFCHQLFHLYLNSISNFFFSV